MERWRRCPTSGWLSASIYCCAHFFCVPVLSWSLWQSLLLSWDDELRLYNVLSERQRLYLHVSPSTHGTKTLCKQKKVTLRAPRKGVWHIYFVIFEHYCKYSLFYFIFFTYLTGIMLIFLINQRRIISVESPWKILKVANRIKKHHSIH